MGGIIVQTIQTTAVNQNLHQEAPHLLLKDPEAAIPCYILWTLLLWLYTYYSLGAGINFRLAVAKNASLYGAITPQLHNVSPLTDMVVHSDVSNGGGNSGKTGDPSGSGGGSGGFGDISGSNDGKNNGGIDHISGSNDGSNNADIGGPPGSSGSGNGGGIAGPPGNIEEPNDNNAEPKDNDAVRASFEGVLFLIMAMVAGITTAVMDNAGSEHTETQKNLLICINISAAICFFSSFFGLMGVVMRIFRGRSEYPNSLIMAQKISLIISVGFMLVTMIMIFVSVQLKLAEK